MVLFLHLEHMREKEDDVGLADARVAALVQNGSACVIMQEQVSNMQTLVLLCHEDS